MTREGFPLGAVVGVVSDLAAHAMPNPPGPDRVSAIVPGLFGL